MMMRCSTLGSLCVLGLVPGAVASLHRIDQAIEPGVERVLIDRQLVEHTIGLIGLGPQTISYIEQGHRHDDPIERFVALTASPRWLGDLDSSSRADPHPWQRIDLIDGQRLVGVLEPDRPGGDESLVWHLPTIGRLVIGLERVATIVLGPLADPLADHDDAGVTSDRIVLLNGDVMAGFVARIGPRVVIEQDGNSQQIPIERIARITLANPLEVASSPLVWLADGSVLAVDGFGAMDGARATIMLSVVTDAEDGSSSPVHVPLVPVAVAVDLERIGAVLFEPGAVVPLGSMPLIDAVPLGDRRWSADVQIEPASGVLLGASDIALPGPMRVRWALPAGATRVAFDAELAEAMRGWGDCWLVVLEADTRGLTNQLARQRLWADEPTTRINEALSPNARTLIIEVQQGEFGPIQDRVVLHRPLVLVEGSGDRE